MADDQRAAPIQLVAEPIEQIGLGVGIDGAGGLIQHHKAGFGEHRPGEGHLLPLPAAKLDTVVEHARQDRVVALGQCLQHVIRACHLGGTQHLFFLTRCAQPRHDQIVPTRKGELHEVLENDAELLPVPDRVQVPDVLPVQRDPPVLRIVESAEQFDQGRLARSVSADQRGEAPAFELQADRVEGEPVRCGISEADIFQNNAGVGRGGHGFVIAAPLDHRLQIEKVEHLGQKQPVVMESGNAGHKVTARNFGPKQQQDEDDEV